MILGVFRGEDGKKSWPVLVESGKNLSLRGGQIPMRQSAPSPSGRGGFFVAEYFAWLTQTE